MPRYRNDKPSMLGLAHRGDNPAPPRMVAPGEVFEANADEIPQSYLEQKWIVPADQPAPSGTGGTPTPEPGTANVPTDAQAAKSAAHTRDPEPAQFEPAEQAEDPHTRRKR